MPSWHSGQYLKFADQRTRPAVELAARIAIDGEREEFVADYRALITEAFPRRPDGKVLFPFRRLFLIAYAHD